MPRFRIAVEGLPRRIDVNLPENYTQEDIIKAVDKRKKEISDAQLYLGPYDKSTNMIYEDRLNGRRRKASKRENLYGDDGLQGQFSRALGLERTEDFDILGELNYGKRLALAMLPTEGDKVKYLEGKFGRENVAVIKFKGKPRLAFRESEDDKFKLVDAYGTTPTDFFADPAGGVAPTVASISILLAPFTKGSSLLLPAAYSSLAYGLTGLAQDVVARGIAEDVDVQLGEIFERRSIDTLETAVIDYGTLRTGRILKSLVPTQSNDLVSKQLGSLRDEGFTIPKQITATSKDRLTTAQDVVAKRPDGDLAVNIFENNRSVALKKLQDIFSTDPNVTSNAYQRFIQNTRNYYARVTDALTNNENKKALIKGRVPNTTEEQIKKRITSNVNAKLQTKLDRVTALDTQGFSPMQVGSDLQNAIFNTAYKIERRKSELYDNVGRLMEGTSVQLGDISRSLKQALRKINDPDLTDSVLTSLRPIGTKNMLIRSIDDIPDQLVTGISYKQLDSMIKALDDKLPYGNAGALNLSDDTVEALSALRGSLDNLRLRTIKNAGGEEASKAYREATDYFKKTVLPFRQKNGAYIQLVDGSNISSIFKQLDNYASGKRKTPPKIPFAPDGTDILKATFKSPERLRETLKQIGANPALKQSLRKKWLESKGLFANQTLKAKDFKITSNDAEIIKLLWNSKKVKDFEIVARQINNKSGIIQFKTNNLFRALNDPFEARKASEIRQLVDDELRLTRQAQFFDRDLLKLVVKGDAPLPEDVRGFADIILGYDNLGKINLKDIELLLNAIGGRNSVAGLELKEALFESIARRASDPNSLANKNIQQVMRNRGTPNELAEALWDTNTFAKILQENEQVLKKVWGEEIYDSTTRFNKVINDFRVKPLKPKQQGDINVGSAASPSTGNFSAFITGIPEAIKSRYVSAIWGANGFNFQRPVVELVKQSNNARNFISYILENNVRAILTSRVGQASFLRSSDGDPAMDEKVKQEYNRFIEETSENEGKMLIDQMLDQPVPMQ